MHQELNEYRLQNNVNKLELSDSLNELAQSWAKTMFETGDFKHSNLYPSGENIQYGKVIETQYFDYKNGNWNDLYFYYTDCYTFGEDFFDWWNRYMADEHERYEMPKITKAEEEMIELFWYKNIEEKREIKTDIILLK